MSVPDILLFSRLCSHLLHTSETSNTQIIATSHVGLRRGNTSPSSSLACCVHLRHKLGEGPYRFGVSRLPPVSGTKPSYRYCTCCSLAAVRRVVRCDVRAATGFQNWLGLLAIAQRSSATRFSSSRRSSARWRSTPVNVCTSQRRWAASQFDGSSAGHPS